MSTKARCKLNSDGSVCLQDILESFHSSIREEHAWALCYQCCKFFLGLFGTNSRENYLALSELNHVFLQTDGNVHPNTFFGGGSAAAGSPRKILADEQEFIRGLGIVMYQALDHGSNNGEERAISHDLEQLISDMISQDRSLPGEPHHETDDEGIEKDSEEGEEQPEGARINVRQVMQRCERHLTVLSKAQVEAHYKAVVRALVTEALELSTFLERVAQGTRSLRLATDSSSTSDLDQLQFADWARFWVQVIGELRMGVKLRKVHYSRAPIEYELTPYEILMKDIRACRYNLRKIMVDGDIPYRVTKDAHAIILEFIRSRPPLKKASDRKLPPQIRSFTPREQLMNSIRKGRPLRPTKNVPRLHLEPSEDEGAQNQQQATRKLIKVDFSQLQDEEEEEDDEPIQTDNSSESEGPGLWPHEEYHQLCNATLEAYDLATQDLELLHGARRHTLGVIEQPWGSQSVPQSRPCSRQSCNSSEADSLPPEMTRSLQDHLTGNGKCWPEGMSLEDRLSLTLEEIVHIRSVLTKAELEALPVEGRVRGDVEGRKICFLCLKTRFGIFGPWGQRCIICKRTVCSRCYSKMNIPMEHFVGVPVALLSPSILATPEDDHRSENSGSNRVTPEPESEGGPISSDYHISSKDRSPGSRSGSGQEPELSAMRRFKSRANAVGKAAGVVDKLKGSQLVVCHDCKMMLQQIIKSARTNRTAIRNKTLQNLSLNLSPVF